jgi:tetratricopeptide (TPR) repeat protein
MASTKRNAGTVLALFLLACGPLALYAQVPGAALLSDEIPLLERRIGNPGLPAAELHACLTRLGRLFLLSGNLEGAADAFNRAAFANPQGRDDRSLLEAARCYLALGEREKADSGIRMALVSGRDPAQAGEARFLSGISRAFGFGDTRALASLLSDTGETARDPALLPADGQKSAILYTLWKLTGGAAYRARLLAEYPASPEAGILGEDPRRQTGGASSAMWLLFPGRNAVSLGAPVIREPYREAARGTNPQPAAKPAAAAASPPAGKPAAAVMLQTGLFGKEENAQGMADRLKKAGFTPHVSRRAVNGASYFAVGVNASPDGVNAAILRLKDSGFDAFPVY